MRLVQLSHPRLGRRVAKVDEPRLRLLGEFDSTYRLAQEAIRAGEQLAELVERRLERAAIDYDSVYEGVSPWKLLPAMDHPDDPFRCLVTGTGLTHRASAENRDKMHQAAAADELNDSMRMYQWGVDAGRPEPGAIGVQPEWFWKGNGDVLRAHGEPLPIPTYADDGGEEPEAAAAYVIDDDGNVHRVGLAPGNEFADHVMEKKNYLYLAHSKIRSCSIGPELVVGEPFDSIAGNVAILRQGKELWRSAIATGDENMSHSLHNIEQHHFKYDQHRRPGQLHIHFLGASAFSFGANLALRDGDVMQVDWQGLGRPLANPLRDDRGDASPVSVQVL